MKRIIACLLMIICIAGAQTRGLAKQEWAEAFDGLLSLLGIQTETKEKNAMNYQEIAERIRKTGIAVSDEIVTDLEKNIEKQQKAMRDAGLTPHDYTAQDIAAEMLFMVGVGTYDDEHDTWMPSSHDVYAFDAEFFNISDMYALFLQGVQSIVPGLDYTDFSETLEENETWVSLPELIAAGGLVSQGTKSVSFSINGHEYQKELDYYGDWFNEEAVAWINEVLQQEGFEGRLYEFYDGMQGVILIYGSEEKAEQWGQLLNAQKE